MKTKDGFENPIRNAMLFSFTICFSSVCFSAEVSGTDTQNAAGSTDRKFWTSKSVGSLSGNRSERFEVQSAEEVTATLPSLTTGGEKPGNSPSYLLMPSNMLEQEPSIHNGCWARIYGDHNFEGGALTLTGPLSMPTMLGPLGINWKNRVRSIEVGKTAVLTVFDDLDFRSKIASFGPGERIANLSKEMGYFDDFLSMKISCKV